MGLIKRAKRQLQRSAKQQARWLYRTVTSDRRVLPDFLIIGAAKSGTTSLYFYLSQHPNLVRGYSQEVHFFDVPLNSPMDNFAKGERWYRTHFPLREDMGQHDKTFESSPPYLFSPRAPKRICDLLPDVRLIALLRNPTERAISAYFHRRRNGQEALGIEDALGADEERMHAALSRKDRKNQGSVPYLYRKRGHYFEHIARFREYFPQDQMLILNSERFFADPQADLRRVFAFVGVDPDFSVPTLRPHNVGTNRHDVDPQIYRSLDGYFAPHNRKLYAMIGTDFGW